MIDLNPDEIRRSALAPVFVVLALFGLVKQFGVDPRVKLGSKWPISSLTVSRRMPSLRALVPNIWRMLWALVCGMSVRSHSLVNIWWRPLALNLPLMPLPGLSLMAETNRYSA